MSKHFAFSLLLAAGMAVSVVPAMAAAGVADQIGVVDPYVRMAPPGAKATGAFMMIKNAGHRDALLVSANAQVANITELHNHINDNGIMRMRQVKEIAIPAKGEVALKPGGYHVMLIDMKAPLKEGDHVMIKLGFADGSSKEVHAPVTKSNIGMPVPMDHNKMQH